MAAHIGQRSTRAIPALPAFLFRAVAWSRGRVRVLDQTRLPHEVRYVYPRSAQEMVELIRRLVVRGAPAIGVAAAYGLAAESRRLSDARLRPGMAEAAEGLVSARPTAVNLRHAVDRVRRVLGRPGLSAAGLREDVLAEARAIEAEETASSLAMARYGAKLVPKGAMILTICDTGALAAPGMGTALGVVFQAHIDGKRPRVIACETRPLLQGSRLTALELQRAGIPVTVVVDSAAASVIGRCDLVLAGADRIAANGDTANKVGTRMLAVLACDAGKPFYVVAPSSSFDLKCRGGAHIRIEERDGEEVRTFGSCRVMKRSTPVFNPAFDVTPARLITAFITERGVNPPGRPLPA